MHPLGVVSSVIGAPVLLGFAAALGAKLLCRTGAPTSGIVFHEISRQFLPHVSWCSAATFHSVLDLLDIAGYRGAPVCSHDRSGATRTALLTFDDGYRSVYTEALPLMLERSHRATIFMLAGAIGSVSRGDAIAPRHLLDKAQLRELSDSGFEIGSHGMSHADLTRLPLKLLQHELASSRSILEQCIGKPVTALSFPYGSWNERVWQAAQECGYTRAAAYRRHSFCDETVVPVKGVYSIDSAQDIVRRATGRESAPLCARTALLSQFSRGTPVWKYRREYYC